MNPARWARINEVFHAARATPAADREAFLKEAAGDDAALLDEVHSLLRSDERSPDFLEHPGWAAEIATTLQNGDSLIGRRIGKYRVTGEIGRGGMGVVYSAQDEVLDRVVALKALPPEYARDPVRRERLAREAKVAAQLSHHAIATVYELAECDGDLYIVSEFVRGRNLREELGEGALPPARLLNTLMDVARALSAAHQHNIIHRDLKPENIVRRADGQIKVLDFGLARMADSSGMMTVTRLTESGLVPGTPGYMAPEQVSGREADARSDIFVFGILAWELATGQHPFGESNGSRLARLIDLSEGRDIPVSGPAPPGQLQAIVQRCMRRAPDERYQSAGALLHDLSTIDISSGGTLSSSGARTSGPLWWWQFHQGILAALDAVAPVLAWLVRRWYDQPWSRTAFLVVLAAATAAVTLRLNLLFTSRVHVEMLAVHRSRLFPWIAAAEVLLATMLLGGAIVLQGAHDATATALVTIAVITLASIAIIEPATTSAAQLGSARPPSNPA